MNKPFALITGASNGIGLELAFTFARNGSSMVLVARNGAKLQELQTTLTSKYGVEVHILALDLGKPEAAETLFAFTQQHQLRIEWLVNNAGFGDFGLFHELNWSNQSQMIAVNITTLTHLCRVYSAQMVQHKSGRILNVASTAAFQPGPTMAVYYATKAYVLHFSEAIQNELAPFGISVTALCPGPTESGFQAAASIEETKLVKGKKLPTSKEVAEYGYKAMMKGKAVAIHGFQNYLMANSVRFTPRSLVVKLVRWIQGV